jgi:hypothetical protein
MTFHARRAGLLSLLAQSGSGVGAHLRWRGGADNPLRATSCDLLATPAARAHNERARRGPRARTHLAYEDITDNEWCTLLNLPSHPKG